MIIGIVLLVVTLVYKNISCNSTILILLQNYTVTDQIQKVAEAFQCKPVEGKIILLQSLLCLLVLFQKIQGFPLKLCKVLNKLEL